MKTKGFTLIELLVVVSIISLLSSLVLASVRQARQKAFETNIVQTMKQFQNALELYKNETGYYPRQSTGSIFYTYKYGGYTDTYVDGDFTSATFLNYFNPSTAFNNSKFPDNFMVYYEGLSTTYGSTLACEGSHNKSWTSYSTDRYVLTVDFETSTGLLSRMPNTFYVYNGGSQDGSNGNYFSYNTACFSTE